MGAAPTPAGAAVAAPALPSSGAPTGSSQRCPGAPCAGLRATVALLLVAGVVVVAAAPCVVGVAAGVASGVNVVGAGIGSDTRLLPELSQEAATNAIIAMPNNLLIIKGDCRLKG